MHVPAKPEDVHRTGHVGLGFLASIPQGLAALEGGRPRLALALTATIVVLSTLPDVDELVPGVEHRTWTHSLPFAIATGLATGFGWWLAATAVGLPGRRALAVLGGTAGTIAVLAHLLGDAVTPMGVAPLWPVARRRRSLDVVPSKNTLANYLLLTVGVVGWLVLVGSDAGLVPFVR